MKRLILLVAAAASFIFGQAGGPYLAPGTPVTVTASSVFSSKGGFLESGRLCFIPSTGSAMACGIVSHGALTAALQIPSLNPIQTYTIEVVDTSLNQNILWIPGVTALSKITTASFSWDSFVIPAGFSVIGSGMPGNYYCASGATYLQSDAPAASAPWRCVNGLWYRGSQVAPSRVNQPSSGGGTTPTSSPLALKINGVNAASQSTLNLKQGNNVTIVDDGVGGVTFSTSGTGGGPTLKTNSATNGSQTLLNLRQGANTTVTDDGAGTVTIAATANPTFKTNGVQNTTQSVLNLKQGTNMSVADDGSGGITLSSTAPPTTLKTNGVANGVQGSLNLKQGANMTLADSGTGDVTFNSVPPTVSVGSVTTGAPGTPASVTVAGTSSNIVLNFVFPGSVSSTPNLTFSPTTLSFPSTTNGVSSAPQTVTVTNTATSYYTVTGISITGTNAADFTQTNNCGTQLASGASCTVNITFKPTFPGSGLSWSESASLSIQGGSTFTSSLAGTGQVLNGGLIVTASSYALQSGQTSAIVANRPVTLSSPITGTTTSTDTSHFTYTAPSHIPLTAAVYGCQAGVADSVLNTKIDRLPVHASNAAWMSQIGGYALGNDGALQYNVLTSTPPLETLNFTYGNAQYSPGPYPLLSYPFYRENGMLSSSFHTDEGRDHHTMSVLTSNCKFYETYGRAVSPSSTGTCQDGTPGCNANSGNVFTPATSTVPAAATDRAGMPLYLIDTLYEIKTNTLHHPIRFTLAGGFISATSPQWPATAGEFGSITNTPPMGARFRLPASFVVPSSASQYAQNILHQFKDYGLILADGGTSGALNFAPDTTEDPAVFAAIGEALNGLKLSNFEIVDQSSLMLSSTSYQVNPSNIYQTPDVSAYMIATDTVAQSDGRKYSAAIPLTLQGVGVGLVNPQLTMVPGSYTYPLQAYVTGASNQTITWALTSGPGSVTSNGVYTPPAAATVSVLMPVVLTATSAADASAKATQYINLIPVSADGHIRIVGSPNTVTDANGTNWWGSVGLMTGTWTYYQLGDSTFTNLTTNPEAVIYQRSAHTYGPDLNFHIIMPNGNYRVRWLNGQIRSVYGQITTFNPGFHDPEYFGTADQITAHTYHWGAQTTPAYTEAQGWDYNMPAKIASNVLDLWHGAVKPDFDMSGRSPSPNLGGFEIIPDASVAHISIDTGYQGWAPGTLTEITPQMSVSAGTTAQLYAVGWYMSNAVTWSVTGGGSINASTGLYTAPTTKPASPLTIVVTATSTVDGSKTATIQLTVPST